MWRTLRILREFWRTRRGPPVRTRDELAVWQDLQVQRHLRRVLPKSAWLRERFTNHTSAAWREIPPVGKAEMMANFDALNTAGIRQREAFAVALAAETSRNFAPAIGRITVGLSSGTSGGRGLFLASPEEQSTWAGAVLAKVLPGSLFDHHRIALFLRANSNLYSSVQGRRIRFTWFDLLTPLASHVEHLNAWRPTLLVAPPSVLRLLAEALISGQLRYVPDKIVSAAETLDPLDKRWLEAQFQRRMDEIYQATEGFLACTDAEGTLRLNEDLLVVERQWLDAAHTRFSPIITDFRRVTQPMIRHRLDDVLSINPNAQEGLFTPLAGIEGRCDDLLSVPTSRGPRDIFPDFICRALLRAMPDLEDYRVEQQESGEWHLALRGPNEETARPAVASALQEIVARITGENHPLSLKWVSFPEQEPPGAKRRRIRRLRPTSLTLLNQTSN